MLVINSLGKELHLPSYLLLGTLQTHLGTYKPPWLDLTLIPTLYASGT